MKADHTVRLKLNVDPLGRLGMNRQIAEQLIDKIISGQLPLSSRLPGEQALAQQLNVSRDVIRRAYQILKNSGHIESKENSGWFVIFKQKNTASDNV